MAARWMWPTRLRMTKPFGRPGASRGNSAYPKIRFVALLENGTHVLFAAHMDKYSSDELTLAEDVVPARAKGMFVFGRPILPELQTLAEGSQNGSRLALANPEECAVGGRPALARRL